MIVVICPGGSNRTDIFGPVVLQPLSEILTVPTAADKLQYLGPRRILAGGKLDAEDGADDDAEDDDEDDAGVPEDAASGPQQARHPT